ncbi:hypothetical protein V865_006259 [Kwoniella europaea PYCC6329]|uniref:Uncharacterized protein n=1 Tax=Kwoniella europaea PYCC6329 TaxID=1423913 RepID=A0AAX4KR20_9TREE
MAETNFSFHEPVNRSPFCTAFNWSTESFSTAATEYTLDREDKPIMSDLGSSKNDNVNSLTKSAEANEPDSMGNSFDDRVRPYLVSYQYLTGGMTLKTVPEWHELAGSRYVEHPPRSYFFSRQDSHVSEAERHDLDMFWKDVINKKSSKRVFEHEAWKCIEDTEFEIVPDESIAKLLTRRAGWLLTNDRVRMKSWVDSQINDKFPERRPNFDHEQYTRSSDIIRRNWPDWPPAGLEHLDMSDIQLQNEEEWGDEILGDKMPFNCYNSEGDGVLVIPEIKTVNEST